MLVSLQSAESLHRVSSVRPDVDVEMHQYSISGQIKLFNLYPIYRIQYINEN